MAERPEPTEFVYRDIILYKSESLGTGSYGGVCRARCDGLLCAAKIMHPTLFDPHDPGSDSYLSKFQKECHLLSLARHPNVVQYLGTFTDPETRLPVLLMELCDENLTAFLERSPGPLLYHTQLNICHDIALALVYLHSNGLIHRDLTGNNVLVIAGPRAKITDFGMSKLANLTPQSLALTQCPGNPVYMSPEALDKDISYSAKLDVFSFGVIIIQVLTRHFPCPTERLCSVSNGTNKDDETTAEGHKDVRVVVPELERRKVHLQLIPDTHPLKEVILQCLKKERQRPSSLELRDRFSELKQSPWYNESQQRAGCNQCTQYRRISELERVVCVRDSEIHEKNLHLHAVNRELQGKERDLQDIMQAKNDQIWAIEEEIKIKQTEFKATILKKERIISDMNQAMEQKQRELEASELLVSELQQSLQEKGQTITNLNEIISSNDQSIQKRVIMPQTTVAESNIRWRKGQISPEPMFRGAAVVNGNTAYFRPVFSASVYSYQDIQGDGKWQQLPDNPSKNSGLVVIDGHLTTVGGYDGGYTNTLLSLRGEGMWKKWSEMFPPMPTSRRSVACVTTRETLIVAGGVAGGVGESGNKLSTVEIMNLNTTQWATISPLPEKCSDLSFSVCGEKLYLAGGYAELGSSKSVFTYSISDIVPPTTLASKLRRTFSSSRSAVWRKLHDLPVTGSTLVSYSGHLLAIGGSDDSDKPVSTVYRYDSLTDSWTSTSQVMNKRSFCFAVSILEDHLIVVGGYNVINTESVEILCK